MPVQDIRTLDTEALLERLHDAGKRRGEASSAAIRAEMDGSPNAEDLRRRFYRADAEHRRIMAEFSRRDRERRRSGTAGVRLVHRGFDDSARDWGCDMLGNPVYSPRHPGMDY